MGKTARGTGVLALLSLLLCFFVMGFVDLVGIASNYAQMEMRLSDSEANLLPSLVFFWFLIFAVPAGMLMNRIGRQKTVLLSLALTLASLLLSLVATSYGLMLAAFSLLGIGNAIMQTSLNPLLSNIISPQKLPSTLTFGQFVKAIASFMAPLVAAWGSGGAISDFGLGWRALFLIYACVCLISLIWLAATPIPREHIDRESGFGECLKLLLKPLVALSFLGIVCHVGIDVGTNTTAPRLLMERCGLSLDQAGIAASVYFIFRTLGCLTGAACLRRISARRFFRWSALMLCIGLCGLLVAPGKFFIYLCIALVGLGNSNVFSIIFSQVLLRLPDEANEVSGLMIMGLFGGTVFPLAMGYASDVWASQMGAVAVMLAGSAYLLCYTRVIIPQNVSDGGL